MTSPAAPDRVHAEALDAADLLAPFRDRFVFSHPGEIYLCGHSLGRPTKAGVASMAAAVEAWGQHLVGGWHDDGQDWLDLPRRVGDVVAGIVGAGPGEVMVCDSTSVNLYKLAAAAQALVPGRDVVVRHAGDFPSDRYVLAGLGRGRVITADPMAGPSAADVAAVLDDDVAVVCLSHIGYRSSAVADMAAVTAAVHHAGALMLWDLSHSAGCYPVALKESSVDLAVGCTYKYLSAGPGAPAFLYVRTELQDRLRQPIWGWFGQRNQFAMGDEYQPWPDIRRFLAGTPPVVGIAGVRAGVEVVAEAGPAAIRDKAVRLGELAVELYRAWLAPLGFALGSPVDPIDRGSHVALRHPDAGRIHRELGADGRVVTDFRHPDTIRLGLAPLTTQFQDVWDAFDRLRGISY
jgi:kynureninase